MKKNLALFAVFLLVFAAGYYLFFKQSKEVLAPESKTEFSSQPSGQVEADTKTEGEKQVKPTVKPSVTKSEAVYSTGEESLDNPNDIQVTEMVFSGEFFSPPQVTIKANDWVFFKNASGGDFWPILVSGIESAPDFGVETSVLSNKSYKYQFKNTGVYEIGEKKYSQAKAIITVE